MDDSLSCFEVDRSARCKGMESLYTGLACYSAWNTNYLACRHAIVQGCTGRKDNGFTTACAYVYYPEVAVSISVRAEMKPGLLRGPASRRLV